MRATNTSKARYTTNPTGPSHCRPHIHGLVHHSFSLQPVRFRRCLFRVALRQLGIVVTVAMLKIEVQDPLVSCVSKHGDSRGLSYLGSNDERAMESLNIIGNETQMASIEAHISVNMMENSEGLLKSHCATSACIDLISFSDNGCLRRRPSQDKIYLLNHVRLLAFQNNDTSSSPRDSLLSLHRHIFYKAHRPENP